MTLNTRVHIAEPVDPKALFLHVLDILSSSPTFSPSWERSSTADPWGPQAPGPLMHGRASYKHVRKGDYMLGPDGQPRCHRTTGVPFTEDDNEYRSTLGQGLAALLEVTYAADGPLIWPPPDWDCGDPTDPIGPHAVSINFDTAYGYKNARGGNCADLHAFLLTEIEAYLGDLPLPPQWCWLDECAGSWHKPDQIHLLGDPERGSIR